MENKQCSVFIETAWQFSIIHYQLSIFKVPQSLPYTTSVSPLLPLLQPKSFRYQRDQCPANNFRLQCKDHTRLQLLLHTRSQYRHFIDFQTDAMTDKLGLLSGSHKVVGKACFGDNIDSEIVKVLTNSTRFRFSTTASCMSRQT